jgi:uncharacterized protein (TIGR02246 family)
MRPRDVVTTWVSAFNRADAEALASFYREDAINHQVAEQPVEGRDAIRDMFSAGFASAKMVCLIENQDRFPTRLLGQAVLLALARTCLYLSPE